MRYNVIRIDLFDVYCSLRISRYLFLIHTKRVPISRKKYTYAKKEIIEKEKETKFEYCLNISGTSYNAINLDKLIFCEKSS